MMKIFAKIIIQLIGLENGYIKEDGHHIELLEKSRRYRELLQILLHEGENDGNSQKINCALFNAK